MAKSKRLTAAEYSALADDYERNPPTADEVISVEVDPSVLRMGRPLGGATPGKTPPLTVRLPKGVRIELRVRAAAESATESELVRRAVVEYLENHPVAK